MYKKFNVSIALCTYNGERFISQQIDSIVNQSYKDFELIIVDDGSTDRTIKIIKNFQKKYTNIFLYQNSLNLGFIKNFEKAISLCKGNYIFLSDQDDLWVNNKIEIFIKEIKDNILIYSDALIIDEFDNHSSKLLVSPKKLQRGSNNLPFLFDNCISGNTMMFRKELVKYILPIPKDISFHDIWISFNATTYGRITFTREPLTFYRRYSEQITHKKIKVYTSIINKLNMKKINKLKYATKNLNNFIAFLQVENIDENTRKLLEELVYHFSNYSKIFFNYKLYLLLIKNKENIFSLESKKNQKKSIFKLSCGLLFYKITLFSI